MTEAKTKASTETALDEAAIAEYLQHHPDFLRRHPDTLAALKISHESGVATSLIERQVGVLRDTNQQLQTRLNELIEMARGNELRVTQVNHLAKALISAGNNFELVLALVDCVKREMRVDAIFVGLRGLDKTIGDGDATIHALHEGTAADDAVTDVFRRGKPICNALSAKQAKALFGDEQAALASAAMVPLGVDGVNGALVLASTDADYFVPDMGTLFLELLGDLVTTGLRRHLGSDVLA